MLLMGAGSVNANGLPVCRIGDIVMGFCGHIGIMNGGSGKVKAEGVGVVRSGDSFSGCFTGTLVMGSPNVNAG